MHGTPNHESLCVPAPKEEILVGSQSEKCLCVGHKTHLYAFLRESGKTIFVTVSGFFPQHIVEGLLNSRRRVSDRPSWILIFKTPARKPTNVVVIVVVVLFWFLEQEGGSTGSRCNMDLVRA